MNVDSWQWGVKRKRHPDRLRFRYGRPRSTVAGRSTGGPTIRAAAKPQAKGGWLPTTHHPPPTTHYPLPTTHCFHRHARRLAPVLLVDEPLDWADRLSRQAAQKPEKAAETTPRWHTPAPRGKKSRLTTTGLWRQNMERAPMAAAG